MSNPHLLATGALPQSGLSNEEQRELLLQLARDLERVPLSRFPEAPIEYIARVKDSLFSLNDPSVRAIADPSTKWAK